MAPSPSAAIGARWLARVVAGTTLPAFAVLVAVPTRVANGAEPALGHLLKTLDVRGYSTRTPSPPFSGATLDGRRLSIADHRGRVVLVNFWATWCVDCRTELPVFERLQRDFGPRGLAIIGVNVREDHETVRRYATDMGLTFPLLFDQDGSIGRRYGVIGLPTTFLVGRDGRAITLAVGPREWESGPARALIETLLAEPVVPPADR